MKDGEKLKHVKAAGFITEYADQIVGVCYGVGEAARVSLTFGRDQILIPHETFRESSPGLLTTQVESDDFNLERVDYANFMMDLDAATRLRDMLSKVIDGALEQPTQTK